MRGFLVAPVLYAEGWIAADGKVRLYGVAAGDFFKSSDLSKLHKSIDVSVRIY